MKTFEYIKKCKCCGEEFETNRIDQFFLNRLHKIYALGMDVPDDFPDFPTKFPQPFQNYFFELNKPPFNYPILVFFVTKTKILYLNDANVLDYPKFHIAESAEFLKKSIMKQTFIYKFRDIEEYIIDNGKKAINTIIEENLK